MPNGSLKPTRSSAVAVGIPGNEPMMTGCCFSISLKNPRTQEPSTRNVGEFPRPCIHVSVTECMTCAQGKSSDGISDKSSE